MKHLIASFALAIGLFVMASPAWAQHGGGHHGGGHHGGGHFGGDHLGGGHLGAHNIHGHAHPDVHGLGHHPSLWFGLGYYSYPTYRYYDYGYSYGYPRSYTYSGSVYASRPASVREGAVARANTARIEVLLPDPEGEVWFEGRKTRSTGTTRAFRTPPLEPGKAYTFKITAAWPHDGKLVTDERIIDLTAGRTVVLDFTRPEEEVVPPPVRRDPPSR